METNISILPAASDHAQGVYALMCELEGEELDRQGFLRIFNENLNNRDICYFVAIMNGCVAGFLSLHVQRLLHHAALIGEIQEIVVSHDCRGRGIGQALFERIRIVAKDAGCVQLEVCCRKERMRSFDFYQKMGMICSHYKLCLPLPSDSAG